MVAAVGIVRGAAAAARGAATARGDGLAALFYVANWRMIFRGGDYLAQTALPSPLEHTCSRASRSSSTCWPLVSLPAYGLRQGLTSRLVSRGGRAPRLWFVIVAAWAWPRRRPRSNDPMTLAGPTTGPTPAVYPGPGRRSRPCWRSGARGTASCAASRRCRRSTISHSPVASSGPGWVGRGGRGGHVVGVDPSVGHGRGALPTEGWPASRSPWPVVIAHVVLVLPGWSARLLSVPPLPALGRISYGVYLWHWPVFIAATPIRTGLAGLPLFTVCVAAPADHGHRLPLPVLVERPIQLRVRRGAPCSRRPGRRSRWRPGPWCWCRRPRRLHCRCVRRRRQSPLRWTASWRATGVPRRAAPPAGSRIAQGQQAGPVPSPHRLRLPTRADRRGRHVRDGRLDAGELHASDLDVRDRTLMGCGISRTAPFRYPAVSTPA